MTNAEKQRKVAEWCGWQFVPRGTDWISIGAPGSKQGRCVKSEDAHLVLPDYPNSYDSCRLFEQEAQRRGLLGKYLLQLWEVLMIDKILRLDSDSLAPVRAMWMATPQERLDAICLVIEGEKQHD